MIAESLIAEAESASPVQATYSEDFTQGAFKKAAKRILPFLFMCYVLNYVDRVNLSFAHMQLRDALSMSDAAYGFGVGIFFLGYIIFEVPSNLLMRRVGAKRTISRIMILWGLASMATVVVRTPTQFYVARIVLGIAEAGFFPGIIYYLSSWFPNQMRARIISIFILAIAVCGVIGGPISGLILATTDGMGGLKNWQWMFILEGIPAVLAGFMALFYLSDDPDDAKWLTVNERQAIKDELARHQTVQLAGPATHKFLDALKIPKVYFCIIGWFALTWGGAILNFWTPAIIRDSGVTGAWNLGLLSAIPYAVGAVGMVLICRHSDARNERHWHFGACMSLSAVAAIGLALFHDNTVMAIICLAALAVGYLPCAAIFFTIPAGFLTGTAAAGAIALISSVGQIGGLTAPAVIGFMSTLTHQVAAGSYVVAVVLFIGAMAIVSIRSR